MRQIIKKLYMFIISLLNLIYSKKKLKNNHIVVMMTFAEDVLPIVEALNRKLYKITALAIIVYLILDKFRKKSKRK